MCVEPEDGLKNLRRNMWTWEFWTRKTDIHRYIDIDFLLKVVAWTRIWESGVNEAEIFWNPLDPESQNPIDFYWARVYIC